MLLKKCKGKKRKLYHVDWGCDFFKDFSYYDFKSFTINGFKGCLYYLDNPNIEKLKEVEKKYHKVKIHYDCDNENDYIIVRGYKVPLNECIRFGTMWG